MTPEEPGLGPPKPIFDTAALLPSPWQRSVYRPIQGLVEAGLGLARMNRIYPVAAAGHASPGEFAERSLAGVGVAVDPPSLVLPDGPLVIVCNHPFGALEALWLLRAQAAGGRPIKLLANAWLHCFEPMRPSLLGVDVLGDRSQAAAANRGGMREALRWLEAGLGHFDGTQNQFFFVTGEDPAFVLVDARERLIVFLDYPADAEAQPVPVWFAARALNTLIIRSLFVSALKNPVTLVCRGFWHLDKRNSKTFKENCHWKRRTYQW